MVELLNIDCMTYMAGLPDKAFDLALVDPPYNVGASDGMFGGHPGSYRRDLKHYANHDREPGVDYFKELFRISENQIIWGSNYYPQYLYHSGAIVWVKKDHGPLSDAEIAFQSFSKLVRIYKHDWSGFVKEGSDKGIKRIHPNQKPVNLYLWCLMEYAKPGDRILDTHLGSGSSAIAAFDGGFDFVGCEIDKDYFEAAKKRFDIHCMQQKLF